MDHEPPGDPAARRVDQASTPIAPSRADEASQLRRRAREGLRRGLSMLSTQERALGEAPCSPYLMNWIVIGLARIFRRSLG